MRHHHLLRRTWHAIYKPLILIVFLTVIFLGYNNYLLDRTAENLYFILDQSKTAESPPDLKVFDILLDHLIAQSAAGQNFTSADQFINLEFSRSLIDNIKNTAQAEDLTALIAQNISLYNTKKNKVLVFFDRIARKIIAIQDGLITSFFKMFFPPQDQKLTQKQLAQYYQAIELQKAWRLQEAVKAFQSFIQDFPRTKEARLARIYLGSCYQAQGEIKRARDIYIAVAKQFPFSAEAAIAKRLIMTIQEFSPRIETLKKRILLGDSSVSSYFQIASMYMALKSYREAKSYFNQLLELNPEKDMRGKVQFCIAWIDKTRGNFTEALKLFEEQEKTLGAEAAHQILNIKFEKFEILKRMGRTEEAMQIITELGARARDTKVASLATFIEGHTYLYELHDPQKAKDAFARLGKSFKDDYLAAQVEKNAPALVSSYHTERAFGYLAKRNLASALLEFDAGIKNNADDAVAYAGKAMVYLLQNKRDEAFTLAKKALSIDAKKLYPHMVMGFIYFMQESYDEAIAEFSRVVDIRPDYAQGHYALGVLYEFVFQYNSAITEYKNAISLKPDYAEAHNNLGHAWWFIGEFARAGGEFKEALSVNPYYVEAHYNLGLFYRIIGDTAKAKQEFENVLRLDSSFNEARLNLDDIAREERLGAVVR
jgi:tetratricopeptide (TPR) repeat protein